MSSMKRVWLAGPSLLHLKDKPLQLTCLDQPVVLFDTPEGPACLLDACPHRQASLALGKVSQGCLACPLHGWEFDGCGAVKRIPAHGEHKLGSRFQTRAIKTLALAGWVFIETGVVLSDQSLQFRLVDSDLGSEPEFTPDVEPFFSLESGSWRTISGVYDWQADFTRVTANGIDFSHLPFVHPKQFGNSDRTEVGAFRPIRFAGGATAEQLLLPPDNFVQKAMQWLVKGGQKLSVKGSVSFLIPNLTRLDLDLGFGKKMVIIDANVPIAEGKTRTYWVAYRNFLTNPLWDFEFRSQTTKVFDADRAVVESQLGPMPLFPNGELSVASDATELQYRSLLRGLVHGA
ncbi:MAG: Rieske 2Fe-2S domain-containing protein [Candidatus Melainabacteria bacterium]|nr:Rieske 2Fe-2S domain-containing protein [Candidatus Melainabacteria bacterium]